jgi:hypothetical protein
MRRQLDLRRQRGRRPNHRPLLERWLPEMERLTMTSPELQARLINQIGAIIDQHVAPIFKPGAKITVLVRNPSNDDADAVVTSDDDAGVRAIVGRQFPTMPSVEYLLGHSHGLEWAAQVAVADDPRTSDWLYDDRHDLANAIHRGPEVPPEWHAAVTPFQERVKPWLLECFGEAIASNRQERNHRFLEEALELVQACGCTANEAHQLVDYTFGRSVGEKGQEVGGVMVTLAALCLAQELDMHAEGETELARISVPAIVAKIRAKQAAKPKHSPLAAQPCPSQGCEEPPSAKQQKLLDLADRIDHEELWRWAGMDHHKMTPEQRDRMNAGVALRRYAQLWAPGRWVVFPPVGPVRFSASTLDKAVEMAKRDESRRNDRGHGNCRMDDGRCGICGGDWSVCGCDGMLRRASAPRPDDTTLKTGEGDAR